MRKDIILVDQVDEVISDPLRVLVEFQIIRSGSTGQFILIQPFNINIHHVVR